jgi:formylglycine-generating enzyme required for sulfatase activity
MAIMKQLTSKIKVFLCYAKEDEKQAREIYKYLTSRGNFDVWFDKAKLVGGQDWKYEIGKAERESDAILICLSNTAVAKEGFVQAEVADALEIAKEKPIDVIFVLPVRLDDCKVPEGLRNKQWIDWFAVGGPENLAKALKRRAEQVREKQLKANISSSTAQLEETTPDSKPKPPVGELPSESPPASSLETRISADKDKGQLHPKRSARPPSEHITLPNKPLKKKVDSGNVVIATFFVLAIVAVLWGLVWAVSQGDIKLFAPTIPTAFLTQNPLTSDNAPEPTISPTITPLPSWIVDSSGVPMILISAGIFSMGSNFNSDELPVHIVLLDDYYIDQYEVTNKLYETCVAAGICTAPKFNGSSMRSIYYGNQQYAEYPVIYVTWEMARIYCEDWRGVRLPTEAEWEKAARGVHGFTYPWGEGIDCNMANYGGNGTPCIGDTKQIGNYKNGQSPYGVYDLAGNVKEWVADWYSKDYYSTLPIGVENPQGPLSDTYRVVRGGSWEDSAYALHSANRNWHNPNDAKSTIGFRCAHSP